MRIFLMWGTGYPKVGDLIAELKKTHEIIYWIGRSRDRKDTSPEIIFHDYFEAYEGKPAKGVDVSTFDPPGEQLIKSLRNVEAIILTMMNKHFDWMCVDERRHLYFGMLRYWYGVLKQYKPDLIIFRTVPHGVFDYLIYELAKMFNIKTIMFWNSFLPDRLFVYNDFRLGDEVLRKKIEENKNKNFSLEDLSEVTRAYYTLQTEKGSDPTPVYTKADKKNFSFINTARIKLKAVVKSVVDLSVFEKTLAYVVKLFKQNIKDEYENVESEVCFDKPFVYLPLHFQPESTSSPLGDMFVDQILMAEIISAALPDGWELYVKEHPSQWPPRGFNFFSSRYRGYYKKIAELSNVRLVPLKTDTYDLINKSQAVATISGVAGIEALMRLKPVMIFGYPWYQDCPGVFKVNDALSCREALQKILDGNKPSRQGIINFLKSVDEAAIRGYIDSFGERDSTVTEKGNLRNIVEVIYARGARAPS